MKEFFSTSDQSVGFLAAINLIVAGIADFFKAMEPAADVFVSFGQVAVAIVTVLYIHKKTKAIKIVSKTSKKSKKGTEDDDEIIG
jgi:hypothetical protein